MKKIYNNWLKKECFIKSQTQDYYNSNAQMYHLSDEAGNTIWNGNLLWWSASSVTLI